VAQTTGEIAPALDVAAAAAAGLEAADLAVADVVEDVLERVVAAARGAGEAPPDDATLDLREQAGAFGVEARKAVHAFADRPVTRHERLHNTALVLRFTRARRNPDAAFCQRRSHNFALANIARDMVLLARAARSEVRSAEPIVGANRHASHVEDACRGLVTIGSPLARITLRMIGIRSIGAWE
jgi:hypothetical protein